MIIIKIEYFIQINEELCCKRIINDWMSYQILDIYNQYSITNWKYIYIFIMYQLVNYKINNYNNLSKILIRLTQLTIISKIGHPNNYN